MKYIITYDLQEDEDYDQFKDDLYDLFNCSPPKMALPNTTVIIDDNSFEGGTESSLIYSIIEDELNEKYSIQKLFIARFTDFYCL